VNAAEPANSAFSRAGDHAKISACAPCFKPWSESDHVPQRTERHCPGRSCTTACDFTNGVVRIGHVRPVSSAETAASRARARA